MAMKNHETTGPTNTEEKRGQTFRARYLKTEREEENSNLEDPEDLPLYMVGSTNMTPIKIPLLVDNMLLEMGLDTGAAITIISEAKYKEHFSATNLHSLRHTLVRG